MRKDSDNIHNRRSISSRRFRATQSRQKDAFLSGNSRSARRDSMRNDESPQIDERQRRAAYRLYPQFESVVDPKHNQSFEKDRKDKTYGRDAASSYFDSNRSTERTSLSTYERAVPVQLSRTEQAPFETKRRRMRRTLTEKDTQSMRASAKSAVRKKRDSWGANRSSSNDSLNILDRDERSLDAKASISEDGSSSSRLVSEEVGALRRKERLKRAKKKARKKMVLIIVALVFVVGLVFGGLFLFNSNTFEVRQVIFKGVDHLTDQEMSQLVNIDEHANLLRIDTTTIASRLKHNSWIDEAVVNKVFPNTIEVVVKEREIAAVVEIPTGASLITKQWFISKDHMWLMPIPTKDSDAAKNISPRIYEDVDSIIKIIDVPFGTKAEIGKQCSDPIVNNALSVLTGMTTELSKHLEKISASGIAETVLFLDNGCEIAFGKAEDMRDKERLVLKILEENPDNVSYINVRIPSSPTWRAL